MGRSPDYLRLATSAARSLATTAFDGLREAALVVDTRPKHLPIVLANAAARSCLAGEPAAASLLDVSLFALLAPSSASAVPNIIGALTGTQTVIDRMLTWRLGEREMPVMTELKLLDAAQGQRHVMLSFAPSMAAVETATAGDLSDWLKLSMNMANMHAWRWDKTKDEFAFATGEGREVVLGSESPNMQVFMARVHPYDQDRVARALEQAFASRSEVRGEFRLKASDGSYQTFDTVARPVFDAAGIATGLVGVTQDVTPRVESEGQLRRSEQLLRATTANTADILVLVDTDLRVRFINKPLAGKSVDELMGAEFWRVAPEEARSSVLATLRHVLATGETANYEIECRMAGPEPQHYENRAVIVRDTGALSGISISIRNITERKRLEQEILDVSNRERQAIGRDLHDGLGQELTGVALMLRGLATRLKRHSPEVVESVNEIVGLVNQSIESTRSLARGLLPVRTDSGGLPFALSALAARSREMYGFEVNFRAEVLPESSLNETSASHLYRVAQEAITNVARHGQASRVDIVLVVEKSSVLLEISDDGVGIGGSQEPETGMGLRIMRYRAGMIGAKFEIDSNMPRGTIVRVTSEQLGEAGAPHYSPVTK